MLNTNKCTAFTNALALLFQYCWSGLYRSDTLSYLTAPLAYQQYKLNKRSAFSLLILKGLSATAAGLDRSSANVVPIGTHKAEGKREFSHCFSHGGHSVGTKISLPSLPGCSVLQADCGQMGQN